MFSAESPKSREHQHQRTRPDQKPQAAVAHHERVIERRNAPPEHGEIADEDYTINFAYLAKNHTSGRYARNIEKNEEEEGIHLMNTLGEVALKRINGACILAPYLFARI